MEKTYIEKNYNKEISKTYIKRDKYGQKEYEQIATYKLIKVVRYNKPYNNEEVLFKEES